MGEHRLKDLMRPENIFQMVVNDLPSQFPPLKTLDYWPNNLPLQPTRVIGREKELAEVKRLLTHEGDRQEVRLVTLTGPGGTGKTRLGLQAATDLLDNFPDGVWFVELATITEPKLVLPTVAAVLGVRETGSTPIVDTLKSYLQDNVTAQLTLLSFMSQFSSQWNLLFADVLIITVLPLVMFLFFQRQIVARMTSGAVKG